jgi:hypothetical protein
VASPPRSRTARVPDEVLEAFRAVAPMVEEFAREHGLVIDRYRQGRPAWELRFARELGGEAALVLSYRERTGHVLDLSAVWWIDDFGARSRRLRSQKIAAWDRRAEHPVLRRQLDAGLSLIDGWREDDLGPARGPYLRWGRERTAASLEEARRQLPRR